MDDYYRTLGVEQFATQEEIKKAYRALAKKWHPDLNHDDKYATEIFKKINIAYQVLSKPLLKADYDQRLKSYLNAILQSKTPTNLKTAQPDAKVDDELENLRSFMNKMRVAFDNFIYEEIDSEHNTLHQTRSNIFLDKIMFLKNKFRGPINRIINLMYEDVE